MEQHPIPRQITTFEFKLIGFMTLKQFLYLVVFVPLGFVVFKLFPIPLINILLGLLVCAAGVAFAFLPINDRPLDVWIKNLFKRLTSPTQYIYHKHNSSLYFLKGLFFISDPHKVLAHIESKDKLAEYLAKTRPKQAVNPNRKNIQTLLQQPTQNLRPQPAGQPMVPPPVPNVITAQPAPVIQEMQTVPQVQPVPVDASVMQPVQIDNVQPIEQNPPVDSIPAEPRISQDVSPSMAEAIQQPIIQTDVLVADMAPTPQSIPQVDASPASQSVVPPPVLTQTPIQPPVLSQAPMPQVQQVSRHPFLTGVVKNNHRIALPGVLVYVKDQNNNPLRLLKTNTHGIFATFNPLQPGNYLVEAKDPKSTYFFDTMNIQVVDNNPKEVDIFSKEML